MPITLKDHDGVVLDVYAVRDRVALVLDDRLVWLDLPEVGTFRQRLVLAARQLQAASVPDPRPHS